MHSICIPYSLLYMHGLHVMLTLSKVANVGLLHIHHVHWVHVFCMLPKHACNAEEQLGATPIRIILLLLCTCMSAQQCEAE